MSLSNKFNEQLLEMPDDVRQAFLKILYYSFLEIRADSKNFELCYALSDHAHNIPNLISKFTLGAFKYYWECERLSFIRKLQQLNYTIGMFGDHWVILEKYYQSLK